MVGQCDKAQKVFLLLLTSYQLKKIIQLTVPSENGYPLNLPTLEQAKRKSIDIGHGMSVDST